MLVLRINNAGALFSTMSLLPLLLLLVLFGNLCAGGRIISEEQLFRDKLRNPNNAEQWNNPDNTFMSQSTATATASNSQSTPIFSAASPFPTNNGNIAGATASASVPIQAAAASSTTTTTVPFRNGLNNVLNAADYDENISDAIASSVLRFAHDIGQQLSESAYYTKSEVFSPLSVMSALSLLMLGARGKSYHELQHLIGLDVEPALRANPSRFHEEFSKMVDDIQSDPVNGNGLHRRRKDPNWRYTNIGYNIRTTVKTDPSTFEHILKVANGVFTQSNGYSLNPSYRYIVNRIYHAELDQLDFLRSPELARQHINSWVSQNTFGKISNIIADEIPKDTNVILASALYFKGFWENNFFEAATVYDDFYPDGPQRRAVKVKMMATGGVFPFYNAPEYNCRIIGLPYKGNLTTMYIIQPHNSTRAKLRELQSFLDAYKIEDMISRMALKTAVLALPKMHFVRNINMKALLNQLGVNEIFLNGYSDLSLIGGVQQLTQNVLSTAQETLGGALPQIPIKFGRPLTSSTKTLEDRYHERPLIVNRWSGSDSDHATNDTRNKREALFTLNPSSILNNALENLDSQRYQSSNAPRSDLFVEDILHKVDFDVNEQGTEAAAATVTYLKRSGTDVLFRADAPFLVLVRHDPTKLALFYAIINEPVL